MAQVKFNRGQRSLIEASQTLTTNEISLARESASGNDWNSIYLGTYLVGTSMLGLMKPQLMQTPTYTYGEQTTVQWAEATIGTTFASGVITTDLVGTENPTPMTTVRKLVDFATASQSGYAANANDSEILTAKAVTALVASVSDNTYYTDGGWNYTPSGGSATGWNTWTAIDSGTNGAHNFSFTLPTESGNIVKHGTSPNEDYSNELLPTSKAVATFVENYFSSVAGGMRYKGSLDATEAATTTEAYQAGDVFIAAATISSIGAEQNDMVVVKAPIAEGGAFSSSNCDVFERNLDGAVTISENMTSGQFVVATGAGTVESAELIYDRVSQNSNAKNTITVTPYTNLTAGSDVTITIDDIYHAKFVNTAQDNTTNSFKDVMIDGTYSSDSSHTTYQAPAHTSNVQINPAQGEIKLMYTASGAQTATPINVAESITNITSTLEWNDLGSGS